MGDMADYYREQEFDEEIEYFRLEQEAEKIADRHKRGVLKWTQKDEEEILVTKMTDMHIVNCYKMMKKIKEKDPVQEQWVHIFKDEMTKREIKFPK